MNSLWDIENDRRKRERRKVERRRQRIARAGGPLAVMLVLCGLTLWGLAALVHADTDHTFSDRRTVVINGSDYPPGQRVRVLLLDDDGDLLAVAYPTANDDGTFQTRVRLDHKGPLRATHVETKIIKDTEL